MTSPVLVQSSPTLRKVPSNLSFTRPISNDSLPRVASNDEIEEPLQTLITQIADRNFDKDAPPEAIAKYCQTLHRATQQLDEATLTTAIWRAWPQPMQNTFREQLWPDLIPCSGFLSIFLKDYVEKQKANGNSIDAIEAVNNLLDLINDVRELGTPLTVGSFAKLKKEPEFEAFKRQKLAFLNEHFSEEQIFQFLATVPQKRSFQKELYGQIVQFTMHNPELTNFLPSIPEQLQQFIKCTLEQEHVPVLCSHSNSSMYERMQAVFRTISQQSLFQPAHNQHLQRIIKRLTTRS